MRYICSCMKASIGRGRIILLILLAGVLAVLPRTAHARVTISEVAWMGTDEGGANCEWIELHNDEAAIVTLSSWSITIENAGSATPKVLNLGETTSVKFSGIAENGYYLVARDSGACKDLSPSTSADWLGSFGTGISNTGSKLTLKNGTVEEDVVDSKNGWEVPKGGVGGKNTSGKEKETPQRTGESWITASPTPRSPNHAAPLEELPEDDHPATTTLAVTVGGTAPLVPVVNPVAKIYVDGGPARIVIRGADTAFTAIAYDSVGTVRRGADITWSYGDGGHRDGNRVMYAYRKAGEYTATVRARDKGQDAITFIPVVVVDSEVSIASVHDDGVMLTNQSDRIADLSGWKIGTEHRSARLPKDTVIAAHSSAFFPFETLALATTSEPQLLYPDGKLAYAYVQPVAGEAKLERIQDIEPAAPLAVRPASHAPELIAPAAPVSQDVAGASVAAPRLEEGVEATVVLKESGSLFSGVRSFMAAVVYSVAGVFSR